MSCRKMPDQDQVAVQLGIERQPCVGPVEQRDDVFEQAAEVGMMIAHPGRGLAEALTKSSSMRKHSTRARRCGLPILQQEPRSRSSSLLTSCSVCGRKSARSTLLPDRRARSATEDDLQGALEELHLALDEQEVARLEGAKQVLAGVPEPGADGAGAVAQLELQIEIAVAIGPELLVGDEVDVLDAVPIGHLLHELSGHVAGSRSVGS